MGNNRIDMYVNSNNGSAPYHTSYLESPGEEYTVKETKKIIGNKRNTTMGFDNGRISLYWIY